MSARSIQMKLSDYVAAFLAEQGVKYAFIVSGGARSTFCIHWRRGTISNPFAHIMNRAAQWPRMAMHGYWQNWMRYRHERTWRYQFDYGNRRCLV